MYALAAALFTSALAIIGKLYFDTREKVFQRRGIAGALAGEIGAYISLLKPLEVAENLQKIALFDRDMRCKRLRAFNTLPTGHPVFDKVAGDIGIFSPTIAREVSAVYNVVTGMRLMMTNLSSEKFLDADDDFHKNYLSTIASMLEEQSGCALSTVRSLEKIANESWIESLRALFLRWSTK